MAATGISVAANVVLIARTVQLGGLVKKRDEYIENLRDLRSTLEFKLASKELAERERKARLSANGKRGRAAQLAKANQPDPVRDAAVAKTISAIAATPMRSRAKVVAPVKAKRTKAKKQAGGNMVSSTGG
jgi:erythromycin esterase-like protein